MQKGKILIVEDESTIAKCLMLILSKVGYSILDIVSSGEEAVDIALQTRPDLVLMDIRLSGVIDGITAFEQIRKSTDIPVVFVSAYADKVFIDRTMLLKPNGYVVKPFKSATLLQAVETALDGH
jgi:CheY-like chemotaxis protein